MQRLRAIRDTVSKSKTGNPVPGALQNSVLTWWDVLVSGRRMSSHTMRRQGLEKGGTTYSRSKTAADSCSWSRRTSSRRVAALEGKTSAKAIRAGNHLEVRIPWLQGKQARHHMQAARPGKAAVGSQAWATSCKPWIQHSCPSAVSTRGAVKITPPRTQEDCKRSSGGFGMMRMGADTICASFLPCWSRHRSGPLQLDPLQ